MRRRRRVMLVVFAIIAAVLAIERLLETRRLSVPRARPASGRNATPRLDAEQMWLDLQILASPRFGGRATDTAGGMLAAQLIASRFEALGLARVSDAYEQPFTFVHRSLMALWRRDRPFTRTFVNARNVVAQVSGAVAPDRFIVVSAHFDHVGARGGVVYPGADDNASGTAALLAIARFVRAHPLAHSVVFAAFDAEELGLRGSRAFVDAWPFATRPLVLDINIDMIGRADNGRLFVAGPDHTPALLPVVDEAARNSAIPVHVGHDRPVYLSGLIDDWTDASDQGPFHDAGVPFLYFGVEDHTDLHGPGDTAERIDRAFFSASAETVLSALLAADRLEPR